MLLKTALALAAKRLRVFPCLPRQKVPACPHGCLDATDDPDVIRQWWEERPDCNVAIATGAASDIFVLDVDGFDGEIALRKLEGQHSELPATVESLTGNGRHVWFRHPGMPVKNSAGKVGDALDVRGDHGYIVAPPSLHPSGRPYAWSVDCARTIADAPDWLISKVAAPAGNGGNSHGKLPLTSSSDWREAVAEIADGRRDVTLTKVAGHLLRRYADPLLVRELLLALNAARCVPPLPDADVLRIVNSIAGLELKRRANGT